MDRAAAPWPVEPRADSIGRSGWATLAPRSPPTDAVDATIMNPSALLALALLGADDRPPPSVVTARPADTGAALVNPGMGWTLMYYSNIPENYGSKLKPSDTVDDFPGLSTVYLRIPWALIEPEEGQYRWSVLDAPAQRWIDKGKSIALRITCSENWMRFATPEWVKTAGAKGTFYRWGKGPDPAGEAWDPDFGDPVFLRKLDAFLKALGRRYDGNPAVAFIDIGSFGMWGEGHTGGSSRVPEDRADPIIRRHIEMHQAHFPRTLLAFNDDLAGPSRVGASSPLVDWAFERGLTLRDDSILVQPPPRSWYHAEMAARFWPERPVIVEHEHFGPSRDRGAWGPADGSRLLEAVEAYHASYLTIHWWPREFLDANREAIARINRRLGYRVRPQELSWPDQITPGQPFEVAGVWINAGVAPCLPGGNPALTLKDQEGGIAAVLTDTDLDVRTLPVGPPDKPQPLAWKARFTISERAPRIPAGTYRVFVSVGRPDGTPTLALPLKDDDGRRRYPIGEVRIVAPTPP
jgi:hypothetical protein